jgi:hypothetical protein
MSTDNAGNEGSREGFWLTTAGRVMSNMAAVTSVEAHAGNKPVRLQTSNCCGSWGCCKHTDSRSRLSDVMVCRNLLARLLRLEAKLSRGIGFHARPNQSGKCPDHVSGRKSTGGPCFSCEIRLDCSLSGFRLGRIGTALTKRRHLAIFTPEPPLAGRHIDPLEWPPEPTARAGRVRARHIGLAHIVECARLTPRHVQRPPGLRNCDSDIREPTKRDQHSKTSQTTRRSRDTPRPKGAGREPDGRGTTMIRGRRP